MRIPLIKTGSRLLKVFPPSQASRHTTNRAMSVLYKHQSQMPRLPVPTLQETAQRYLQSVKPLLTDAEFSSTQKAVAEFVAPGGSGEVLQKRLLDRAKAFEKRSWLIDWWNDYAYMAYRDPVVINVNYFFGKKIVLFFDC